MLAAALTILRFSPTAGQEGLLVKHFVSLLRKTKNRQTFGPRSFILA